MTLIEELRQASRYTALDHHRDLLERAAAEIERKDKALAMMLRQFTKTPSSLKDSEARCAAHAALSTQGEKT